MVPEGGVPRDVAGEADADLDVVALEEVTAAEEVKRRIRNQKGQGGGEKKKEGPRGKIRADKL